MHTGDVAHNGLADEYAAAAGLLCRLGLPIVAAIGNRDRRQPFREAFLAGLGERFAGAPDRQRERAPPFVQYAVRLGPLRVLVADTLDATGNLGAFCDERARSLDRLLGDTPGPVLLVLHHPPVAIPSLANPLQYAEAGDADRLTAMVARHGHVIHTIAGHTHRADTVPFGSRLLSTMPSVATDVRRGAYPAAVRDAPVYQVHRIDVAAAAVVSRSEVVRLGA